MRPLFHTDGDGWTGRLSSVPQSAEAPAASPVFSPSSWPFDRRQPRCGRELAFVLSKLAKTEQRDRRLTIIHRGTCEQLRYYMKWSVSLLSHFPWRLNWAKQCMGNVTTVSQIGFEVVTIDLKLWQLIWSCDNWFEAECQTALNILTWQTFNVSGCTFWKMLTAH